MICLSKSKEEEKNPFRFAKHNMSRKNVGWLVGARDSKILELKIKSEINNKSGINLVSLVHMFSRIFPEFSGFSKIQELVL